MIRSHFNNKITCSFIRNEVKRKGMRKIPRPFKMPWGGGMVVEEVSIVSKYHEPTIQLLQFDSGDKVIGSAHTTMEGSADPR